MYRGIDHRTGLDKYSIDPVDPFEHDEERAYRETEKARGSRLPLSEQEKAVMQLHEVIDMLTKHLSPVLTPDYPSESNTREDGENKIADVSPLAEQMSANNRAINRATHRLHSLMERIEC